MTVFDTDMSKEVRGRYLISIFRSAYWAYIGSVLDVACTNINVKIINGCMLTSN